MEYFVRESRLGLVGSYNQAERSLCTYKALKAKTWTPVNSKSKSEVLIIPLFYKGVLLLASSHFMHLLPSLIQALHSLQTHRK